MGLLQRVKKEISEVATVTVYFLLSFLLVGTVRMLFLAEYAIQIGGLAKACVAALVVAKVVVVLDKTKFGDRFRRHAVALDVVYKALVYTLCAGAVMALEKVIHEWSEGGGLVGAALLALEKAEVHRFAATVLCLFLVFLGYALLTVLAEHFGRANLRRFLLHREARSEQENAAHRRHVEASDRIA